MNSAMDFMSHRFGGIDGGERRPTTNTGWHPMSTNFSVPSSTSTRSQASTSEGAIDQQLFGRSSYSGTARVSSVPMESSAPHRSAPSSSHSSANSSSSRRRRRSAKSRSSDNGDDWAFSSKSGKSVRPSSLRASSAPRWRRTHGIWEALFGAPT